MTQFVEPVRVTLKTALRTGFVRLEIFCLALWTLHNGAIIAYYLLKGKHLQAACNDFERRSQNPMDKFPLWDIVPVGYLGRMSRSDGWDRDFHNFPLNAPPDGRSTDIIPLWNGFHSLRHLPWHRPPGQGCAVGEVG
jgi:hypothetical protein